MNCIWPVRLYTGWRISRKPSGAARFLPYLRRNWGGAYENIAILVAIAVKEDGCREGLGAAEGMKADKASWVNFFQWLRDWGLNGVKLIVGNRCLGMLEAVGEVFPEAMPLLPFDFARSETAN